MNELQISFGRSDGTGTNIVDDYNNDNNDDNNDDNDDDGDDDDNNDSNNNNNNNNNNCARSVRFPLDYDRCAKEKIRKKKILCG